VSLRRACRGGIQASDKAGTRPGTREPLAPRRVRAPLPMVAAPAHGRRTVLPE
jgi:hypothetical protein